MEPQANTQFTGTPESQAFISYAGPKASSGPWKFLSIVFILLTLLAAGAAVFFFLTMNTEIDKVKDRDNKITNLSADLTAYKEATGTTNPDEVAAGPATDFKVFYDAMATAEIANATLSLTAPTSSSDTGSYIRSSTDAKYQIAHFNATQAETSFAAYFYRTIPTGTWTYSTFSGQTTTPLCTDLTEDEVAAFEGILECTPEETDETETPTN